MIRVLIADDHCLFVEGLNMILNRDGIQVVGSALTGRQTIDLTSKLKPHVVLLDIRMPDMDGLQALAAIKASCPETSVIILTSYNTPEYITRAISLGAAGYLMKDTTSEGVINAIRTVASGEAILDLDRALVLNPSLASAYYVRGLVYGSKGEYDKASRDLDRAVELDPSFSDKEQSLLGASST